MATIEYFYSAHSAFAYIGSRKLMEIAAAAGRRIVHRPYDLRRGMIGVGATKPKDRTQAHMRYFFGREIHRWAEERSVSIMAGRPTHHDNAIAPSNRLLIAAERSGANIDALAHAMLEAHWRDDADLADEATLLRLADAAGLNGKSLIAAAGSDATAAVYDANTDEAIRRSVFGSPTYFVDGDMFYGQDRLELVARACAKPYADVWRG